MDISEIVRKGFQNLHKDILDKNYKKRSLLSRRESFMNARRQTRDTLLFNKRNLNIDMSPYVTPEQQKKEIQQPPKPKVETNKRWEMLKEWRERKNKQKLEEKKRAKPIFKVCHIDKNIGLPNLEKVNKEIKGKPIKTLSTPTVLSFAPANHIFKAPKSVKPVQFAKPVVRNVKQNNSFLQNQKSTKAMKTQPKAESRINVTRSHRKDETRFNENTTNKTDKSRATQRKPIAQQKDKVQKPPNHIHVVISNKEKTTKPPQVKSVGWDLNHTLDTASNSSEHSGKRYQKTPIKRKRTTKESTVSTASDQNTPVATKKVNGYKTPIGNCAASKMNMSTISSANKSSSKVVNQITPNNTKKTETFKTPLRKSISKTSNSVKKTPKVKSTPKIESTPKQKNQTKIDNSVILIDDDLEDELEKVVIYDDEEITLRTPVRKSRLSRVSSIRKSAKVNINNDSMLFVDMDTHNMSNELKTSTIKNGTTPTPRSVKKQKQSVTESATNLEQKKSRGRSPKSIAKIQDQEEVEFAEKTPPNNANRRSSVYISPFVTISRGKDAARKEFEIRKSTGGTFVSPEGTDFSKSTSPQAGADYFETLLNKQISRIKSMCELWEVYQENNIISEEATDMINVVIGQSNLLITKKFEQFRDLISQCKSFQFKEKTITCEDLHGFWDMMYKQVIDLDNRFENLERLKRNNWEEVLPEKKVVQKRAKGRAKKPTASSSSSIREMIKAARNKMKTGESTTTPEPVRKLSPKNSSGRKSLRVSVLKGSAIKRLSSPGLTMMKVTQAIKAGNGITPSKSILKTNLSNSVKRRHTKSVLFVDNIDKISKNLSFNTEDKENNPEEEKLNTTVEITKIIHDPATRRSSRRLSKIS